MDLAPVSESPVKSPTPCPRCRSGSTHRHGFFCLRNGTRQHRYLCRACGRTYNPCTGTPLHYIKKRDRWGSFAEGMAQGFSVRRMAATLDVQVATAFRWRHRVLSALCLVQQPVLTGKVAACDAYIRYSEKGSRKTNGPGSYAIHGTPGPLIRMGCCIPRHRERPLLPRFRRFADGKPSCVLVVCSGQQHAIRIVGAGRPTPDELHACLHSMLGDVAELLALEHAPYAEACRRLGIIHQGEVPWDNHIYRLADALRGQFHVWLLPFRGVATQYLTHYLAWFRCVCRSAGHTPVQGGHQMLAECGISLQPCKVA